MLELPQAARPKMVATAAEVPKNERRDIFLFMKSCMAFSSSSCNYNLLNPLRTTFNPLQTPPIPFSSIHYLVDVELEFVTSIAAFKVFDGAFPAMDLSPGNALEVKNRGTGAHF